MLAPYLDVLRRSGAFAMSATALVARLPISMIGLGIVLLVSLQTGSYALAGALSAVGALCNAVIGPFPARLLDRFGQARVLPWLTSAHVAALTLFVVLVLERAPVGLLFLTAAVQGALMPSIGALVRARWAHLLIADPKRLRTAFAYESVVDEVIFVVGPPLATMLAITLADWSALAACALLISVGTVLLVPQRGSEPPAAGTGHRGGRGAIRYPGMPAIVAAFVLLGGLFGAFEVTTVAFTAERGEQGAAGILLAVYSFSSGAAGLAVGALKTGIDLHRQLTLGAAVLALTTVPFGLVHSLWLLGVVCLLAGLAVSPVLISGFALVAQLVPARRLTEGLVWTNAGLGVGISMAAAGAGAVIDSRGASTAYLICTACAIGTFLAVLAGYRNLERAWQNARA